MAAPAGYGNPTSAGLVGHSAETAGFEPARDLSAPTFLAGRRTRPDYATSPVGTRIACSLDRRQPPLPRCVPTFSRYAPGSATWTGGRAPTARMRLVLQASDRPEVQMHTHASAPVLFSVWKKSVRGPWAIFGVKPPKDGACARVGSTVFGGGADRVVEVVRAKDFARTTS